MPPRSPKLYSVHQWMVGRLWSRIEPSIAEALKRSNSDFTSEDILRKLYTRESQLWIILDGARILAVGTTEFTTLLDGRKLCVVGTFAGADMEVWDHLWEGIEDYARRGGCDTIQIVGRPGWVRYMKARGFKQPWAVLEKKL